MHTNNSLSCYIIGEETLLILCADALLEQGHQIYGLFSTTPEVCEWAAQHSIPLYHPEDDLVNILSQQPFDYLFSIINQYILRPEVLCLPRKAAINYHDALLPRYAGTYATSWAIMHREPVHGITWHIIEASVDTGAILKQIPITLAEDETSFGLNMKSYAAAHRAFAQLIRELASGAEIRGYQDLSQRSFFGRYKRPQAAGLLTWSRSARDLNALVRGLNFGPFRNELCLPKLLIGQHVFTVLATEVLEPQEQPALPGTILAIAADSITVATAESALILSGLTMLDGQPLSVAALADRYGLGVGSRLETIDEETAKRITSYNTAACKHEEFWRARLAALQPLTLPYRIESHAQRKRPRYQHVAQTLPGALFDVAQRTGWSLPDMVLTAFAAYLSRISGAACFDIGFKPLALQQDLIGMEGIFAETVPLRVEVDPAYSFAEAYAALQRQQQQLRERKTFARDLIARYPELRINTQLYEMNRWVIAAAQVDQPDPQQVIFGSELTLLIDAATGAPTWVYDTELLDPLSLEGMLRQWHAFLHGLAADLAQPIGKLPMLTTEERLHLHGTWNATHADFPDVTVVDLFEAQAARTPERDAVVYAEQRLSYAELDRRANRLAHQLQQMGVGPEVIVGVCVDRSPDVVVALLAILKAGGAYLAIDPNYPRTRIEAMCSATALLVVITQSHLVNRWQSIVADTGMPMPTLICIDERATTIQPDLPPVRSLSTHNLAYVLFTSGSTGQIKGVMITQRSLANAYFAWETSYRLRADAAVHLQMASFAFDVFTGDLVRALCSGGTLVLCPTEALLNPQRLYALMHNEQVACAEMVPVVARSLAQYVEQSGRSLSFLKLLLVGSDSWHVNEFERLRQLCGPATRVINSYGLTEVTIDSTYFEGTDVAVRGDQLVPIGRPFANTTCYLLDRQLQPVPVGIPGELYIGGYGLARGYLNRPDLTAERFIPNPFLITTADPAAPQDAAYATRLYHTGDIARYLPDGSIEYLGRADQQVKIRGFRIELGEIQAALSEQPGVQASVVVARDDSSGVKQLVAYLVPAADGSAPATSDLRAALKSRLPDYMIPSVFVLIPELPLTPNCKVDHAALPAPDVERRPHETPFIAPRTAEESQLAAIWSRVLGVEQIGVADNFFDLGGHSLHAIHLMARVQETFQVDLPMRCLFEEPTIAGLAQCLEQRGPVAVPS